MITFSEHLEFILAGFIALIVWAIRLEGKVKFNEEKVNKVFSLEEKIGKIRESLARIEGQLGIRSEQK